MMRLRQPLVFAATIIVLIAGWWAYVHFAGIPPFILPTPLAVANEIGALFTSGRIWPHLGHTLGVLAGGLLIGSALGGLMGIALAKAPRVERVVGPYLFFFQTAPKIALAPLFVLWFGLGLTSKLVLTISLVFFPVMIGAMLGIRSAPANLMEFARLLKLGFWTRLRKIELPGATPEIFAGLKVAAVQAVIGAILAEWISGDQGLGYLMVFAGTTYRTPLLFAMVLITALLGIVIYQLLGLAEKRLMAWR